MQRIFIISLLLAGKLCGQGIQKTMLRLPDTGQTNSYTNTPGEDSDFLIHVPGYIDNGDGTLTDTITGLMWQKGDGGEMRYASALVYCDTLTLGGYNDWRLPKPHEAFSLMNLQNVNPALNQIFINTTAEYWYTSVLQANDTGKIWATNAGGGIGNHPKTETISAGGIKKFHPRAVRQVIPPTLLPAQFSDNGDGTVNDLVTGLTWKKNISTDTLTWENALVFADTCTSGGYNDWRLPNIKEIHSLNNESLVNPSVDALFFPGSGLKKIWSSTSLSNQTAKAWYLDTRYGITTYYLKTRRIYTMLVRGSGNIITHALANQKEEAEWFLYPNPSGRKISISGASPEDYFQVYKLSGELVFSGDAYSVEHQCKPGSGLFIVRETGSGRSMKILVTE
ncbi:MAG: DUF1566 domain-containing protein [Bacteroidota bacterium]|jgi:hypothetical protein